MIHYQLEHVVIMNLLVKVIVESSKQIKKRIQQEQIQLEENFQNIPKNDNYDNVNTHYTIKYSLYPTAITNEKICGVMGYNLRQINLILVLLYLFEYDITNNGFVKENELEFEIQNENALIIFFSNRFDCDTLSQSTPSPTVDQCRRIFDFNKIGTKLCANHVLECVFNGNNNGNSSSDCYEEEQGLATQIVIILSFCRYKKENMYFSYKTKQLLSL